MCTPVEQFIWILQYEMVNNKIMNKSGHLDMLFFIGYFYHIHSRCYIYNQCCFLNFVQLRWHLHDVLLTKKCMSSLKLWANLLSIQSKVFRFRWLPCSCTFSPDLALSTQKCYWKPRDWYNNYYHFMFYGSALHIQYKHDKL